MDLETESGLSQAGLPKGKNMREMCRMAVEFSDVWVEVLDSGGYIPIFWVEGQVVINFHIWSDIGFDCVLSMSIWD